MKQKRNLFISYSLGVSTVTSLLSIKMFVFNYLIICLPLLLLAIAYFIAILVDRLR